MSFGFAQACLVASLAARFSLAFFGGIGGGIVRDVLLNQIPGPLKNVNFLIVSLLAGILGLVIYRFAAARGGRVRKNSQMARVASMLLVVLPSRATGIAPGHVWPPPLIV